jgi:hypothetical protein
MKKPLQFLVNNLSKDEIDLLFGEGSEIQINFIKYSTNNKCYTIDCKLLTTNPELCLETFPVGLDHLMIESWSWMGYDGKFNLTSTIDIK